MRPVIGIDPSLTATAAVADTFQGVITTRLTGPARLDHIRAEVEQCIIGATTSVPPLIVIEGYAYGRHNKAHQIGELGCVLRLMFWTADLEVIEVPPSTLKKFATGKGNAGKDLVVSAVTHRAGRVFASNDIVDATVLHAIGHQILGQRHCLGDLPQTHLSALDKITKDNK